MMAMPQGFVPGQPDEGGPTTNVDDYRRVCIDFIQDISSDYKAWVDYYKLPPDEDAKRRYGIDMAVSRSCEWIARVPLSIKDVDIVMNDGIQKMAEATAGRPFQIGIFVNGESGYTAAPPGPIQVRVRAAGREGCQTMLGYHFQKERFRIESSKPCTVVTPIPQVSYDTLDVSLTLDGSLLTPGDVVSLTVTVCEIKDGAETERRGITTIIHIREAE